MSFNESAINELPLNEGGETTPERVSLVGKISIIGSIAEKTDPKGFITVVGQVYELSRFGQICIKGEAHQRNVDGKICLKGEVFQRSVDGAICLVSVVRELAEPVGPHSVPSSTPTGVLPETGSAIFTRWEMVAAKEITVKRHWDIHESGRANFDDTRKA